MPTDVVERIEAKAKGEGRPFNRILVDELALFPHLDRQARLGELVRDMESVLARYGSRITMTELNEEDVRDPGVLARLEAEPARLQQAVTVSGRRVKRTVFDRH